MIETMRSITEEHLDTSWKQFIKLTKAYGFKCGFCQKFTDTGIWPWSNKGPEEEEIIFFHEEKGFILYANSYRTYVKEAKLYGEIKADVLKKCQLDALSGCDYARNGDGTMTLEADVSEGFCFKFNALVETFEFSKSWSKVPFLWFLNYVETEQEDYSRDSRQKINEKKIAYCTPEVSRIIFGI